MSELDDFQLLVGTFEEETTASESLDLMLSTFRERRSELPALATVVKNAAGDLTIRETDDIGKKKGAIAGGVAGGLLGLFGGKRKAVVGAGLGALLGGMAADRMDTGIPDPQLEAIGASLAKASSAIVAIVATSSLAEAKGVVAGVGGTITVEPFARDTDFMRQLREGDYDSALTSLASYTESFVANAGDIAGSATEELTGKASDLLNRDEG